MEGGGEKGRNIMSSSLWKEKMNFKRKPWSWTIKQKTQQADWFIRPAFSGKVRNLRWTTCVLIKNTQRQITTSRKCLLLVFKSCQWRSHAVKMWSPILAAASGHRFEPRRSSGSSVSELPSTRRRVDERGWRRVCARWVHDRKHGRQLGLSPELDHIHHLYGSRFHITLLPLRRAWAWAVWNIIEQERGDEKK